MLQISGHTDSIGTTKDNQSLSERRAKSVLEYFTDNDLPESRFKPVGFGAKRPVATNANEAGRAKNRRTEFKILSTGKLEAKKRTCTKAATTS